MLPSIAWIPLALAPAAQGAPAVRNVSTPTRQVGSRPPNILVVVADDLGTDLLTAYERFYPGTPTDPPPPPTPSIDWLAEEGMLFTDCWTNPVCTPTRAQVLTGRYGQRTGIGGLGTAGNPEPGLDHREKTLPQFLRKHTPSYFCAAVGKWHLATTNGAADWSHPLGPSDDPWFDLWAGSLFNLGAGDGVDYNRWEKTFATPVDPIMDEYRAPRRFPGRILMDSSSSNAPSPGEYATVDTIDDAVQLIGTMPEPWFLYVAFNAPHIPPTTPAAPLGVSSCQGFTTDPTCTLNGSTRAERVRCMTQWMDNELGRLLCDLDAEGLDDSTVVLFLGDNGTVGDKVNSSGVEVPGAIAAPFDPDHGKGKLYQGGVNVPLIVRGPGIAPGVSHHLVSSTDLLATAMDLAGAATPGRLAEDSVSFAPLLRGSTDAVRKAVFVERFNPNFDPAVGLGPDGPDVHVRAIRDADYKLIRTERRDENGDLEVAEELFDLRRDSAGIQADPYEQVDLRPQVTPGGSSPLDRAYRVLQTALERDYPSLYTR